MKMQNERRRKGLKVKTFLLTLGVGMVAGGAVALLLPPQSPVRSTMQKAVDSVEQSVTNMMQ